VFYCGCVACREDLFSCHKSGKCIDIAYVCNGYDDCGDWSDERNCSKLYFFLFNYCLRT